MAGKGGNVTTDSPWAHKRMKNLGQNMRGQKPSEVDTFKRGTNSPEGEGGMGDEEKG